MSVAAHYSCIAWVPSRSVATPGRGRPAGFGGWKVHVRTPFGNYTSSGWQSRELAAWQADVARRLFVSEGLMSAKGVVWNFPDRAFDAELHVGDGLRATCEKLLLKAGKE